MAVELPSIVKMLEAGVHFGHHVSRWHPKMEPFIFGAKNNIHIIDVEKTLVELQKVQKYIDEVIAKGGVILFLGTKKQAQSIIKREALRCGMPFLVDRWIGGFITNFAVVIKKTKKYKTLVKKRDAGELNKYTKKEQLNFEKEITKLEAVIGGVKDLEKIPDAIFVWDIQVEKTAVAEAKTKNLPLIGVCDTNSNPELVKYSIPANDDGLKSIEMIATLIADFVIDAKAKAPQKKEDDSKKEGGSPGGEKRI